MYVIRCSFSLVAALLQEDIVLSILVVIERDILVLLILSTQKEMYGI